MDKELEKAYEDYIELLGRDLDRKATICYIHDGMGATPEEDVKEGERLRALIAELKKGKKK